MKSRFCFVPIIRDMNAITREARRGIIVMGSNGAKIIVTVVFLRERLRPRQERERSSVLNNQLIKKL